MDYIAEVDWRYMRGLLDALCEAAFAKMNARTAELLAADAPDERTRYHRVYDHARESRRLLADCLDDWRRSNMEWKIALLRRHEILSDEQYVGLSKEARARLDAMFRTAKS